VLQQQINQIRRFLSNAQTPDSVIAHGSDNKRIKKKHLKLVLLDLYVVWVDDPAMNIAVHMSQASYSNGTVSNKGNSRYNKLNIKGSTIKVVHKLDKVGLIGLQPGWQDMGGRGFVTRIWPTEKLVEMFEDAAFGSFNIGYAEDRETIILRDEDKKDIEYDDTPEIIKQRSLVQEYNKLLEKTFIDIQSLEEPRIEIPETKTQRKENKPVFVNISHHDKFVRRVFNNSSFDQGGRFYGGWWQRIDGNLRKDIRLNNSATVEIDYSALHVILAYAEAGISYWHQSDTDPYDLPVEGVDNPEHCRSITKLFLLLSFNASNETSLFKAFRSELNYSDYPYTFPDDVLLQLLNTIKENHPKIKHLICNSAGLRLMNIDSDICEYVIADFIKTDTPILSVHDSFIVPFNEADRLHRVMEEGFKFVTYRSGIKVKFNQNLTKAGLYVLGSKDRDWFHRSFEYLTKGNPTVGYAHRMKRHQEHFSKYQSDISTAI
jgi:hypothetical protein